MGNKTWPSLRLESSGKIFLNLRKVTIEKTFP